ncbi:MAG: T9SS type A sorting domain-containing protein [Fibrobacterota bacterium]
MKICIIVFLIFCYSFAYESHEFSSGLKSASDVFITNNTDSIYHIDGVVKFEGDTLADGAWNFSSVVGDTSYMALNLLDKGLYLLTTPRFELYARIVLHRCDPFSSVFIGLTDESFLSSSDWGLANSILVRLGATFDEDIFGVGHYSPQTSFSEALPIDSGYSRNSVYNISISLDSSEDSIRTVLRSKSDSVIVFRSDYFDKSEFSGLNFFTVTVKGFDSEYGKGYAKTKISLDSLSIKAPLNTLNTKAGSTPKKANESLAACIALSPNPFNPEIRLDYFDRAASAKVRVFNARGMLIAGPVELKGDKGKYIFDASSLPGGVYLFRVSRGNETHTLKAVYSK